MITVRVHGAHDGNFGECEDLRTTRCPKCNTIANSWEWPSDRCKGCGCRLVNIVRLISYQFARVDYHREGPY